MGGHGYGRVRGALVSAVVLALGLAGCGPAAPDHAEKHRPPPAAVWDRNPRSLAAVGDSITRGFDACSVLSDCPQVSWATGSDEAVRSLAVRLLGVRGATERSWNYARTGARMADVPGQIERAAARKPQLVTVMAGSNDVCRPTVGSMTSVADFRVQFEKALRVLRAKLPTAQVYVASVPDLKRLWSRGRTNPLGKQIWKLGICPTMLGDADALDTAATTRRDETQRRVRDYNTVLRTVCATDARCRYDGDAVFDYRFDGAQLSHWDWFHPSRDGQSRLAEIAYRAVTAARPAP